MAKHRYSLERKEGDSPIDHVFAKSGHKTEFTVREVAADRIRLAKMVKEMDANADIQEKNAASLLEHNPQIADISEDDARAAHKRYESERLAREYRAKSAELAAVIESYDQTLAAVAEKFGPDYDVSSATNG